MSEYRRLLRYLRPYVWPHGVIAVICMLGFSAAEGTVPFLLKYTVDHVLRPPAVVQAELAAVTAEGGHAHDLAPGGTGSPIHAAQRYLDDAVTKHLGPVLPKGAAPLSLVVIGFFVLVQLRGWFDFGAG